MAEVPSVRKENNERRRKTDQKKGKRCAAHRNVAGEGIWLGEGGEEAVVMTGSMQGARDAAKAVAKMN
jgi:hypothetical protein